MNNLTRPIIFFDLETTGPNAQSDRIVQLSFIKLNITGTTESHTVLVNPEMPISPKATEVHGITDEMVQNAKTFKELANRLNTVWEGCDLAGYNILRFDIPVLLGEMKRAGIRFDVTGRRIIDVFRIYQAFNPRNLSAAYKFYCEKELENAHDAGYDTMATLDIFTAMLKKHDKQLPPDVEDFDISDFESIHRFCMGDRVDITGRLVKNENGDICFNFGKHKGSRVKDAPDYASWMLGQDFPDDVKEILKAEVNHVLGN